MTPHIQSIRETLQSAELPQDPTYFGNILASSIAAIMYLSKGFSKSCPQEVQAVLAEALSVTIRVVETVPAHVTVRRNSVVLFQRMIQCLGNRVLRHGPSLLRLLIEHCVEEDVQDVAQIFNQLCIKFQQDAVPAVEGSLLPFLQKCHSLMPNTSDVVGTNDGVIPPHLQAERLSTLKLTFVVVQHIVTYKVTNVLLSPANSPSLLKILQAMYEGASAVQDPVVKKTCIQFFRELTNQWVGQVNGSTGTPQSSFLFFVLEVFIPGMLRSLGACDFNRDALLSRCVTEFSNILWSLKAMRAKEFDQFVLNGALAGCPSSHLEILQAATNAKEMNKGLQTLLS
eukprot:CAMPEP_0116544928 /NCGR_PEP_ID=MMETSP0397-20121206/2383_1 /TAXON_ID=216820 /ORGANISM="Cyclophora tenuis, Strain ECT3854" /LENGTH=340 /DNA_ID=CAMNT_0004069181 /DNA_START=98 /DNA_END=1116 /DNA_ORIENTATION=+